MKPRYVLVNEYERAQFEKEWQLPYGYGGINENYISLDPSFLTYVLEQMVQNSEVDPNDYVIEKISDEGREIYYRI